MKTSSHFSQLYLIITLFLISSTLIVAQENWEQLPGPFGGNILTIDNEGDNYVAGTSGGGVFLSTDIGNKWTDISEGLPFLRVDYVLIKESKIFVAKNGENIFVSHDFGKTWEAADNGLPTFSFTSLVKLEDKIYCSIFGSGVFVSTDYGENWLAKNNGLDNKNVNSLTVYRNAIYAATQTGAYLSGNYGENWEHLRNTNFNTKLIAINDKDIFIATNLIIQYSSNNGLDWYTATSAVGKGVINSMISTGPYLIVGRDSGLFVATYAWNTWTKINSSLEKYVVGNLHLVGNFLYACTKYGLFVSADFGNNWVDTYNGIVNQIVTKVLARGDKIYAGTQRNGVFVSKDKGQTWENMNLGNYRIIDMIFKGEELFVLSSEGIFSNTNDGVIWEYRNSGLENRVLNNFAINGEELYIGTDKGMYRSTNDGWRWDKVSPILETHRINSIYINSNQEIYVATEGNIYFSTDHGETWDFTNYGMTNLSTNVVTGNDDILVVGTYPEKLFPAVIYTSYDKGQSWETSNVGWEDQYVASISISGLNIFANVKSSIGNEDVGVLFSSNNGKSWHTLNEGLAYLNVNNITVDNNKIYAATNGTGIYVMDVPPLFLAVNLLSPIDKTIDLIINPLLDWDDAQNFDYYSLQISTKSEKFDKHLILDTILTNSEFQLPDSLLENDMDYYWRVMVVKGSRKSDWSDIFSFKTEKQFITKANLLTPADNSENIPVLTHFSWDELTDATDYYLQVSTSNSFSDNVIDLVVPDTFLVAPKGKLDFTTKYYWRVKAKIHNFDRDWSEVSSFTTEELNLNPPKLISPENNSDSLTLNITLKWALVPNADKYFIQLSSDESFADTLVEYTIADTSYKIPDHILDYDSTYYWRVKAILNDAMSDFSNIWTFSTMREVGVDEEFVPINNITIAPNPVSDFAKINFTVDKSSNVCMVLYNSLGNKARNIFDKRLDQGQYSIDINTADMINGIYFVKISVAKRIKVLKLILSH